MMLLIEGRASHRLNGEVRAGARVCYLRLADQAQYLRVERLDSCSAARLASPTGSGNW